MKKLYMPNFHSIKKTALALMACFSLASLSAEAQNQHISSLTLVNADTNEDIMPLVSGAPITIYLDSLPTRNINVRANDIEGQNVGAVLFFMNNRQFPLESHKPFAMFGDVTTTTTDDAGNDTTTTDYNAGALPFGQVIITARPFVAGVAQLDHDYTVTLSVTQTSFSVTSFTLVNAETHADIMPLTEGMVLNLGTLGTRQLNIRANTDPAQVGSVMLTLNNGTPIRENIAPYSLFGDSTTAEGVLTYRGGALPMGTHALVATPYSRSNGNGDAGTPLTLTFTVEDSTLTANPGDLLGQQAKMALTAFPNPASSKATIQFSVASSGPVTLDVYDLKGSRVQQLFADQATAGTSYSVNVPTADLHNGVYFFRMTDGKQTLTKRLVVTK